MFLEWRPPLEARGRSPIATKAAQFLGNLAKKSERNVRNGNPRKYHSDTGKR